jgi:SAM-dependent methyltransferase
VRLSRKIEKLFSFDVLESLWEHAGRLTHPVNARRILGTIDRERMSKLREQFPYKSTSPRINRFEDADYWVGINVERAQDLWLDRTPPLRILDLGCGAGFFLYLCRLFGHDALGLDTDNEPLFRGTLELLNVRRVVSRIEPDVPLLDLGQRFDLVTAHRVCFHRIRRAPNIGPTEWTRKNWRFFISDIRTRFLEPEGRLLLDFNPRRDGSSFFTPELRACFLAQGARIFRSKALFATDPNQRPKFKQINRVQLAR